MANSKSGERHQKNALFLISVGNIDQLWRFRKIERPFESRIRHQYPQGWRAFTTHDGGIGPLLKSVAMLIKRITGRCSPSSSLHPRQSTRLISQGAFQRLSFIASPPNRPLYRALSLCARAGGRSYRTGILSHLQTQLATMTVQQFTATLTHALSFRVWELNET